MSTNMSNESTLGHTVNAKTRTSDVELDFNMKFEQLFLDARILAGLKRNNFIYPSPIQTRAIPLASCGRDLYIRAKSGTGKTLVFVISALQRFIEAKDKELQTIIISPTREIAVQIRDIISELGSRLKICVTACIGGTNVTKDRKQVSRAQCIVGTPGRLAYYIRMKAIQAEKVKLVVLDEADKLMTDMPEDVKFIVKSCKNRVQTLVVSATFNDEVEQELRPLMNNPLGIEPRREPPILHGISQFVYEIPATANMRDEMNVKLEHLVRLLHAIDYNQVLIFVNSQNRAESYCSLLTAKGFVSDFITGGQKQDTRLETFRRIKVSPNCNIVITTDLLSRGIDAERVNVVINMDVASNRELYLHRIGRGGRFGSIAIAISMLAPGDEFMRFKNNLSDDGFPVYKMTQENAALAVDAAEKQIVEKTFEIFSGCPKETQSKPTAESSEMKQPDILPDYETLCLQKIEELNLFDEDMKNSSENNTDALFLQKIEELNLFGEETPAETFFTPEDNKVPTESEFSTNSESKGNATNEETSGSESDDEESSDEEFSDDESSDEEDDSIDYFENILSSTGEENEATAMYHSSYNTWTNTYWNMATQIRDYARYSSFVRQQQY